ncbi:hypothetical protein CFOL_v3_26884 [Cephalotus follicularis]|uniref:Uncharacterized protein n=1 Tax=Cephalotus follicularis TaxID=3775 RepID=A0A1Q3CT81_CEPFO|nr:hypothetical protein CFOL_v3_26884 [Cephalotus follicularis]
MGRLGCNLDGNLNDTKFAEPMPWIGIYVAVASSACAVAMAADAIHGFHQRKFWFPCKYFTINATSLTLIGIAIKLSVDLYTSMPGRRDQLTKLSSSVFMCTVMGNSMPSLGTMENKEIFMNIIALGILVFTLIVNICIQLGTGVIYLFWKEHAFVMFLMLVLLVILSFSALTVPCTKRYLELKYNYKYNLAVQEGSNETGIGVVKKLKQDLMKFCMMAHTSSPQFVMGRSVTCTASGALCLLCAMILAEAMLQSFFMPRSFEFCKGESDYKWSTTLVLVTQTIAVGVGTFAPAFRWLQAINFSCPKRGRKSYKDEFRLERYWIQGLVEMKDCPLALRMHDRRLRKLVNDGKKLFLNLCIGIQTGIVFMSKVIRLISIYFASRILICCECFRELNMKFKPNDSISNDSQSESKNGQELDLSRFVLFLEGENALVELMMKKNCSATVQRMHSRKKHQPKHLVKLLEMSTLSMGFKGVKEFDNDEIPSLDSEQPPNCWALPVVTLTSIALILPDINHCSLKQLRHGVTEGLKYVKYIENSLDANGDLRNVRMAADVVWQGVDLYHKWLDVDLRELSLLGKTPEEILEGLADFARNKYMKHKKMHMNVCLKETPGRWPIQILAANSMYRVSKTILRSYESRKGQPITTLFEALVVMISDILGACLTNLLCFIANNCLNSRIEEREESVRQAAYLLGETEQILRMLDKISFPGLIPDQMASINEWRLLHKLNNPFPFSPISQEYDAASSSSHNVFLTIE